MIETAIQPGRRAPDLAWQGDVRRLVLAAQAEDPARWDATTRPRDMVPPRYFQYPAMMVAEVQRTVLGIVRGCVPAVNSLVDPFVGSGTMMTEAMRLGMSAYGQDINPLAVLISTVSTRLADPDRLTEAAERVTRSRARAPALRPNMPAQAANKWFGAAALHDLGATAAAVRGVEDLDERRFMWVALAETVRLCSNSRTSTYKLHVRPAEELPRVPSVPETFDGILTRNIAELRRFRAELEAKGRLEDGRYGPSIEIRFGDTRKSVESGRDVLVTSPPYGDNASTVPYGQASYLALAWIDLDDIGASVPRDILESTLRIDHRSLGGSLPRRPWKDYAASAMDRSAALRASLARLESLPRDRVQRVATFVEDLDSTLDPIIASLRPGAPMVWTIGNRRVGGAEVPLTTIVEELLRSRGCEPVVSVRRQIRGKRMAIRNNVAATMRYEEVLVLRGPGLA